MKIGLKQYAYLLFLCIVLSFCGGCTNEEQNDTIKTSVEESSYVSTEKRQVQETESEEETQAERMLLSGLKQAGISEYTKIDLSKYEELTGVSLEEDYVSYQFFYESDGLQIEAFIVAPLSLLETGEKQPILIYNHGGNRDFGCIDEGGMVVARCAYLFQTICIATNYRGCGNSEGQDGFGGEDVNDVIHLIDLCENLPYVDANQMNMLGMSRGGMMTYETLRVDDRIHRAVVFAGMADAFAAYEARELEMKQVFEDLIGGTPEQMPEEYEKRSATYWAEEIKTPLLLVHATGDPRVDISQAASLADKLEATGLEFEAIFYDADVHGNLRREEAEKMAEWFRKE